MSRLACPVAPEHRYEPDQLNYHYSYSLATIRRVYQIKTQDQRRQTNKL